MIEHRDIYIYFFIYLYFVIVGGKLQLVVFVLAVNGPIHAVRCESVSQANDVLFFCSPDRPVFVAVAVSVGH